MTKINQANDDELILTRIVMFVTYISRKKQRSFCSWGEQGSSCSFMKKIQIPPAKHRDAFIPNFNIRLLRKAPSLRSGGYDSR